MERVPEAIRSLGLALRATTSLLAAPTSPLGVVPKSGKPTSPRHRTLAIARPNRVTVRLRATAATALQVTAKATEQAETTTSNPKSIRLTTHSITRTSIRNKPPRQLTNSVFDDPFLTHPLIQTPNTTHASNAPSSYHQIAACLNSSPSNSRLYSQILDRQLTFTAERLLG